MDFDTDSVNAVVLLLDPLPLIRHRAKFGDFVGQPGGPPAMIPPFLSLGNSSKLRRHPSVRPGEHQTSGTLNVNNQLFEPCSAHQSQHEPLNQDAGGQDTEPSANARFLNRDNLFKPAQRLSSKLFKIFSLRSSDAKKTRRSGSQISPITTPEPFQDSARAEDQYSEHCLYKGLSFRVPIMNYSHMMAPENGLRPSYQMDPTLPTLSALEDLALRSVESRGPLDYLIMIILWDTSKILRSMERALAEIGSSMLDESRLQAQIDYWRKILNQFETELRRAETSLRQFAAFIPTFERTEAVQFEQAVGPQPTRELFDQCLNDIESVKQRTESAYRSLISTMSLVESKRGIAEAESVTKLTELAFLFIPLTFSASVFSMQVKELNAATVSLGDFFIVAVVITVCSYSLRLFIRSPSVLRYWKSCKDEIRTSTNAPPGTPIRASSFLKWIWRRLNPPISPIFAIIPTAALMATLWTRPLHEGIKAGITIMFGFLGLALVFGFYLLRIRNKLGEERAKELIRR